MALALAARPLTRCLLLRWLLVWWAERFALWLACTGHLGKLRTAGRVGAVADVEVGVFDPRFRDEFSHLVALFISDERDNGA